MPRKKKIKEDPEQLAQEIFMVLRLGNRQAKCEIITKLILANQIEFIDQVKLIMGDEYNRIVPSC